MHWRAGAIAAIVVVFPVSANLTWPRNCPTTGVPENDGALSGGSPPAWLRRARRAGSGSLVAWCQKWHHRSAASIEKIEKQARNSPDNVSYSDMLKLCTHYFGEPRSGSGSHNAIFKMPWQGDPRINLQNKNGKVKPYQVKQAIAAIDRSKEK
jgi:hypothetical protein